MQKTHLKAGSFYSLTVYFKLYSNAIILNIKKLIFAAKCKKIYANLHFGAPFGRQIAPK